MTLLSNFAPFFKYARRANWFYLIVCRCSDIFYGCSNENTIVFNKTPIQEFFYCYEFWETSRYVYTICWSMKTGWFRVRQKCSNNTVSLVFKIYQFKCNSLFHWLLQQLIIFRFHQVDKYWNMGSSSYTITIQIKCREHFIFVLLRIIWSTMQGSHFT